MADLAVIPYQDDFETYLAQTWDGSNNTIYVNAVPTATTPAGGSYSYIVVDPGKSTMQVRKVTAWENVGNTFTATTATIAKGYGLNYATASHSANAVVRFSNNYQFWADIQTAIATKTDIGGGNKTIYASTAARDTALGANGVATKPYTDIWVSGTGLFYNYNLGTAQWEAQSTGTTTPNASTTVAGKSQEGIVADNIAQTEIGSSGAPLFMSPKNTIANSATSADSGKAVILNTLGQVGRSMLGALVGTGADGASGDANITITGSDNTYIVKNYTTWTAGSVARAFTVTPANCIVHIKIQGDANFTNWSIDFSGKGAAGGAGGAINTTGTIGTVGNSNMLLASSAGLGGVGAGGGGAAAAKSATTILTTTIDNYTVVAFCGAGGGGGGGGSGAQTGGAGGTGGGCIIFEIGGNVTFSSTTATVAGVVGTVGQSGSFCGGGGGGGGGGTFIMLYRGTLTGSLTPTVTAGAGGAGGTGGSSGTSGGGGSGGATIFTTSTAGGGGVNPGNGGAGGAGSVGQYLIKKI